MKLGGGWTGEVDAEESARPRWASFLEALAADPSQIRECQVWKHASDRRVLRVTVEVGPDGADRNLICRYVRLEGWRAWAARVRGSSGRRQLRRAAALLHCGIATARPWALLERGGAVCESWLVTDFLDGAVDLDTIVLTRLAKLDSTKARRVKNGLALATAGLVAALDGARLHYRDFKASNVLIADWDSSNPRAFIVDLEGLREAGVWPFASRTHPMVRLAASLLDARTLTTTDFVRLVRAYFLRRGQSESAWRARFSALAQLAVRYARRAKRRKSGKLDGYSA